MVEPCDGKSGLPYDTSPKRLPEFVNPPFDRRPAVDRCRGLDAGWPICVWVTSSGTSRAMARVTKVWRCQCVDAPASFRRSLEGRADAELPLISSFARAHTAPGTQWVQSDPWRWLAAAPRAVRFQSHTVHAHRDIPGAHQRPVPVPPQRGSWHPCLESA